jgi:sugar lactone lactonase YvrE
MRHNQYMARYPIVLLLACAPLLAQHQYTIATIAGNGAAGIQLNNPLSVAVDSAGDVYFGDWTGTIRKFWAKDGSVTTFAGVGILGYSGDGQQAVSAMLGKPGALALDAAGNLFIADSENNRIRRVDALTGVITTIAGTGAAQGTGDGGLAIHAAVPQPTGVALDAAGNLYFSSSWSQVRKVTAATGVIETIAGQATTSFGGDNGPAIDALFWDPVPSAVSANGDIYLADFENSRIRMIAAATGIVTTFAGAGACKPGPPPFTILICQGGFAGDGGPAHAATLNYPSAAALDAAGNLYISDGVNHRIRRVDAGTGVISTIAGNGVNGFSGDGGPALAAQIGFPTGIAVDHSGRVYFADENNNRIRVLIPSGTALRPAEASRRAR